MAASPKYKVYNEAGAYVASCKDANDAAVLLIIAHQRGSVRLGHSNILVKGAEASGSYDDVTYLILKREMDIQRAAYASAYGHSVDG